MSNNHNNNNAGGGGGGGGNNDKSMGELFKQRRAGGTNNNASSAAGNRTTPSGGGRQQQPQQRSVVPPRNIISFTEIQAEQQGERRRPVTPPPNRSNSGGSVSRFGSNSNNNNNRGGGRNPPFRAGDSSSRRPPGSSSHHSSSSSSYHHQPEHMSYPIEQGVICTLKESFGFIHCAERAEEVFFHYSQLIGASVQDLHCDETEVEFRIGPSPKSSNSNNSNKLAAFQVKPLAAGVKIEWERVEFDGQRVRGLVERRAVPQQQQQQRRGGGGGDTSSHNNSSSIEGTIRLLHKTPNGEDHNDDNNSDESPVVAAADGPLVRYMLDDCVPFESPTNLNSRVPSSSTRSTPRSSSGGASNNTTTTTSFALNRGDLVECRVVTEKRTGLQYARDVTLLLSERERAKQEEERRLMSTAKEEIGVVTALKGDYGFLKSSSRRERIFFRYDSINMDDTEHQSEQGESGSLVLKEGQEMKFWVVEEEEDERRPRRVSARRVSLQPRGSVKFFDVVCRGAVGTVLQRPQCHDAAHELDQHGRILLEESITVTTNYDAQECEATEKTIKEIYLSTEDSPGGKFSFHGGQYVGLWIQTGDKLLFDIVQDYSDGACRAVPTVFLTPPPKPIAGEDLPDDVDVTVAPAVRLIEVTLAGRAEGVVSALKDIYGFIQFAERPVDVHFKMYQMLPDALQDDLRRNMGFASVDDKGRPLRLELGAEVHFDLSVHGTIHSNSQKLRRQQKDNDRENLKAQRILLLPPNTIQQVVTIASDVKGTVSKQDPMQPYIGNIEFDPPLTPMSMEQRHPMVAKMISTFLDRIEATGSGETVPPVMFHDVHSKSEDDVIIQMLESMGAGKLNYKHIPWADAPSYAGRLCIQKADTSAAMDATKTDLVDADKTPKEVASTAEESDAGDSSKSPKKTMSRQKTVKSVRYDKHSFSSDVPADEAPPSVDDVVLCNVSQDRRTGQSHIENMKIVERHVAEYSVSETSSIGIVKEVVPARNFGFISVIDETSANPEMLFFQLRASVDGESATSEKKSQPKYRKGDAVKFEIGTEKNGKRVALNVSILPKNALLGAADKNACHGLVLQTPSVTRLSLKTPVRRGASNGSNDSGGRWNLAEDDRKHPSPTDKSGTELGCILLTEDPTGMFKAASGEDQLKTHLRYKNGAIAIHGAGSSSAGDESTFPRRGDLVAFVKSGSGVRDIRIMSRAAATLIRGQLQEIKMEHLAEEGIETLGRAKFVAANDESVVFDVSMADVVSCEPSTIKENENVEGILYEGSIFGIARTVDLYLDTKLGVGHKERPKLNLTVKKDRGGRIMAQSAMAKGPDGTHGFAPGWTARVSKFVDIKETAMELSVEAEAFVPPGSN